MKHYHYGQSAGFTLIEIMITLAILGILVGLVVPGYANFVQKSRRAEAHSSLLDNANRMEQFFLDRKRYPKNWAELGYTNAAFQGNNNQLLFSDPTPDKQYYILSFSTDTDLTTTNAQLGNFGLATDICTNRPCFILVATAINAQAKDSACATMAVTSDGTRASRPKTDCW